MATDTRLSYDGRCDGRAASYTVKDVDAWPLWIRLLVAVLATWRVSHLIVAEDGPWDIVVRLRRRAGPGMFGRLMDCFYCTSLWIAAPCALIVTREIAAWAISWLAVSGGACLLERLTGGGQTAQGFQAPSEGDSRGLLR